MSPAEPRPVRLLVVDDAEDNRVLLNRRLTKRGFQVVEADSGMAALALIAEQDFDLVLLDIMMPGIDGLEVLRRIRATLSPDQLPVLMVTAKASNTDVVEALELGANDYITKPVDFPIAFARIKTQITRKQAQQAAELSIQKLVRINEELEIQIAERQRSDAKSHYLTYHDALTGLGNRLLFQQQLAQALQRSGDRDGIALAVLFLGIDDLKSINDTLGYSIGDLVLAEVAERLRRCVGEAETVARVESDEFAAILTGIRNRKTPACWLKRSPRRSRSRTRWPDNTSCSMSGSASPWRRTTGSSPSCSRAMPIWRCKTPGPKARPNASLKPG